MFRKLILIVIAMAMLASIGCRGINQGEYKNRIMSAADGSWAYTQTYDVQPMQFAVIGGFGGSYVSKDVARKTDLTAQDIDNCFTQYTDLSSANPYYTRIVQASLKAIMNGDTAYIYYLAPDGQYAHIAIGLNSGAKSLFLVDDTHGLSEVKYVLD